MSSTKQVMLHKSIAGLPRNGWFQPCCVCDEITGNTQCVLSISVSTENRNIEYITYICNKCNRKVTSCNYVKNKLFTTLTNAIISHLNYYNICHYSIGNVVNTSNKHTQLTYILRQNYLPVEPNPPAPL
jgi:hypothetical protein